MPEINKIPEGFALHKISPVEEQFLYPLGPWYFKDVHHPNGSREKIFGIYVEGKHTNIWGTAHGGMLISMADSALGYNLSRATDPPQKLMTVHLNTDFISSPKPGDWIETEMKIHKIGAKMSFADCYIKSRDKIITRTSGVFTALRQLKKISIEDQND